MTRTERRLAERFGLKIPLRVRIAKSAGLEHTVESLNVSTRGISFATDLPLCKGSQCISLSRCQKKSHINLRLNGTVPGHVVHVQPNSSSQGANYVGVGFDCYEVLLPVRPSVSQVLSIGMNR